MDLILFCTFFLFLLEALIHYNIGNKSDKFIWPNKKEWTYILITLFVFSYINSATISYLSKYISTY